MPRRSSSSSTSCSSATTSPPARIKTSDGQTRRSAQNQLADRRVLLKGRQRHAAAAGAGLDSRSLYRRGRDPGIWADDRLHGSRNASGISAFLSPVASPGRSTAEFSSNIDLIDVLPPGSLRGDLRGQRRRHGHSAELAVGKWIMRCERAHAGRYQGHGRQFAPKMNGGSLQPRAYRKSISRLTGNSCSHGSVRQ